jgi:4-aminobutyrate aminotransferase
MSPDQKDFAARAKLSLSPVLGHYTWLNVERGEGSWLYTTDGRKILDLTCGIAVTAVGHAHPKVVAAVREQVGKLLHICAGVAIYEPNVAYAEQLAEIAPGDLDTTFFCNSGAEAIESAIKFARQVTGRPGIIGFRGGFHGRTTGAAALTSSKSHYKVGYAPLLPEVYIAPFPYALRCGHPQPHTADECAELCADELLKMLDHVVPPENVAAFIIEPVLGEGGYVPAPPRFLQRLRAIAKRFDILLIYDEVQTGFGRTGAMFAAQKYDVVPDALVLAKALGGGLPLGALVAPRRLHDKWQTGTHGSTFGGNPVSCAAGGATLQIIRQERLAERAETLGEIIVEELRPIAKQPNVAEIRRLGSMVGVEFQDEKGKPDKSASKAAIAGALERNVLIITAGSHDQVVRFIPPLNIAEDDLRHGVRAFVDAVKSGQTKAAVH